MLPFGIVTLPVSDESAANPSGVGTLLAGPDGAPRPPDGRETATAVISALAALYGAWGVRVHDVRATVDALKVVGAWTRTEAGLDG